MNMAFLSSFRIGPQAVYPEELRERLESFPLLENIGDAAVRHLLGVELVRLAGRHTPGA